MGTVHDFKSCSQTMIVKTKSSRPSKSRFFCLCVVFVKMVRGARVAYEVSICAACMCVWVIMNLTSTSTNHCWYYQYFSQYFKYCPFRFLQTCQNPEDKKSGELDAIELRNAEGYLVKFIQKESFNGVEDEHITPLTHFEDEHEIFYIKIKISERKDVLEFRHPAIFCLLITLFVTRLVYGLHVQFNHAGAQEGLWDLISIKCCQKISVRDAAVFEVIGVDMAGPLYLKNGRKAWICIFTCAVFIPVHLELVTSLSTEAFIHVLRRCIASRGAAIV
ncbi:hypothetical protein PR048_002190 [Dryococelus australis]|uniref:Uncharacterized protein n=1 Tax=Dryococelus australis TaxID=614101 RepID=A0ABQ9IKW0_9NEOP|nr:hypothetical protein PR048_002190 [Dryococelus australis]